MVFAIDAAGLSTVSHILHYVFCVFDPPFTLPGALYRILRAQMMASAQIKDDVEAASYWDLSNDVLPTILIMICISLLCFALIVWLEGRWLVLSQPPPLSHSVQGHSATER